MENKLYSNFYERANLLENKIRNEYKLLICIFPCRHLEESDCWIYTVRLYIKDNLLYNFKFTYFTKMSFDYNINNLRRIIDENIIKMCKVVK